MVEGGGVIDGLMWLYCFVYSVHIPDGGYKTLHRPTIGIIFRQKCVMRGARVFQLTHKPPGN